MPKDIPENVRIVCSQYPMAIPFVQADDRLCFSLPFRSIATDGKREGVVDGPFFSTTAETDLGRRLLRNFESDGRVEVPIVSTAAGKTDLEQILSAGENLHLESH